LKRYELLSPTQRYLERVRKYVALVSLSLGASIFWGAVVAGVLKWAFDLTEVNALVFCGLPVAMACLLYFSLNRHQLARSAGFDEDM
jgi:hypothetical protein